MSGVVKRLFPRRRVPATRGAAVQTLVTVAAGFHVVALSHDAMRCHVQPRRFSPAKLFKSYPRPRVDRVSGGALLARSSARLQRILSASFFSLFDAAHFHALHAEAAQALCLCRALRQVALTFRLASFSLALGHLYGPAWMRRATRLACCDCLIHALRVDSSELPRGVCYSVRSDV